MNPPAALYGAMNRDKKPFTYTPGGLDLSEIKSERMAKRLMRNAMNQGVPEKQQQHIQSPTITSSQIPVPNYNCLPVQVFPTFNLPANPKSLLRSVSENYKEGTKIPTSQSNSKVSEPEMLYNNINNNVPYTQVNNNHKPNRPTSMYELSTDNNCIYNKPRTRYGSDGNTVPFLPEISYDAEYLHAVPAVKVDISERKLCMPSSILGKGKDKTLVKNGNLSTGTDASLKTKSVINSHTLSDTEIKVDNTADSNEQRGVRLVKKVKKDKKVEHTERKSVKENGDVNADAELTVTIPTKKPAGKTHTEVNTIKKILSDGTVEEIKTTTTTTTVDGKTEVSTKTETRKLPKAEAEEAIKQAKEQEKTEKCETVVQNGDSNNETELVVKLPTKKSSARTETKIAVENKILSDGTVEETKTTTTTTTIDGISEVSTKVDKRILSKEEADAVIEVEEEEVEVQENEEQNKNGTDTEEVPEEENQTSILIKNDERSESTTTKKVVVIQDSKDEQDSEPEEEIEEKTKEEEDEESENKVIAPVKQKSLEVEDDQEEEEVEEEVEETSEIKEEILQKDIEEDEVEEEEETEEQEVKGEVNESVKDESDEEVQEEKETQEEEEQEEEEEEAEENVVEKPVPEKEEEESEYSEEETETPKSTPAEAPQEEEADKVRPKQESPPKEESKPSKEPSVPLEKVEDVEIKPITSLTKANTENTEIVVSHEKSSGPLSTQTEFNRYENVVTINRTTKRLDHEYEQMTQQQSVPTMRTYFAPSRDRVSISPSRAYQSSHPPESDTERRHSLLLERLSTERQMPADVYQNYQYTTQTQEQFSQEPQSEVLTVSNVKPSSISKNQQWYQQSNKENVIYNNVTPTTPTPNQGWTQPQHTLSTPQPQQQPQFQPQYQYQPSYTESTQDFTKSTTHSYSYAPQTSYTPQPSSQPSYTPQPSFLPQSSPQPSFTPQTSYGSQPQQSCTPQFTAQPYSYLKKETSDNYVKTPQQYSSSYVPPPWEQDSSYVPDNSTNYYQPQATSTPATKPWQPSPQPNKFSKPPPTAYVPPAPNQSFVKTSRNDELPKIPGRKTYYSEYERRYISVPDSTYVPGESKFQPQPDPSPKYFYDNNEPTEPVEHQWRKELREFTEKTSQTQYQTEQVVRPPWEDDPKYAKTPIASNSQTPSWSQTLRPRSWRERSFESEYVGSQEWPKSQSNTLGRGRPLSSYVQTKAESQVLERSRGVSVDRYNPNQYQSPIASEHPPVQSHTLTPGNAPHKNYHNPNVPAYHTRASAEPREQPGSYHQTRVWSESRASPLQSRSFKYLQWITGTEN